MESLGIAELVAEPKPEWWVGMKGFPLLFGFRLCGSPGVDEQEGLSWFHLSRCPPGASSPATESLFSAQGVGVTQGINE